MYVAIESITKQDDTYVVNTFKKDTRDDAESSYHSILASAAKSPHKLHAATILNAEGKVLKTECYKHDAPAPEPEPEPEEEPAEEPEETETQAE